ncbi:universal stress protein [Natronomonas sp. LN261]|jgi:nucleotide-binding universal stress UspA family protein|uniref:universal stress protein n=1 Tax=Natronomonas sp. LN261 TaxID=2750669 RepID=UPI0015EFC40F|nr:universal stress protein [Natronomonas sp. LN261]
MYTDILYPTDGSDGAEAALDNCRDLAETYDATVHVLYVAERSEPHGLASDTEVMGRGGMVGDPEGSGQGMVGDRTKDEEIRAAVEAHGTTLVEEAADRLGGVETQTAVREGNPFEVILDYADAHDVDVIIMGTHGRTGLDRYLLGSVAEKVVRMSDVPVLTVREETAETSE